MGDVNRAQLGCCAITAGENHTRNRCVERDPIHRGSHWSNVEQITCDCKYFCYGHDNG